VIVPPGCIYAVNRWEEGLALLRAWASRLAIENIRTLRADTNKGIPLDDSSIDVCPMAAVLHDLLWEVTGKVAMDEIVRCSEPAADSVLLSLRRPRTVPDPLST
jgi:hypothetical protein